MKKIFLAIGLFLILIGIVALFVYLLYPSYFQSIFKSARLDSTSNVIAKVGQESIYQRDLDYELSVHPQKDDPAMRKTILEKIVSDSVILQGGKEDGFVTLDESVFNSPNKDYTKRVKLVDDIKAHIDLQAEHIEGSVISIWYRNDEIGPLGIEKAKEIAYQKITALHKDVLINKKTMDQAAEAIKIDSSLAQVDRAYVVNAQFKFNKKKGEEISFDKEFSDKIWRLEEGQVSDVYLIKNVDSDTKEKYDAVYSFAKVDKKVSNPSLSNFADWYLRKKGSYEITYY